MLATAHLAFAEKVEQLTASNYLNDYARVVDAANAKRINDICYELEQKTQAQVTVVTIHSLEGDEAADFANRLFKRWGVGDKQKDRGVLVLFAVDDHKYWTEVGYGLEPILPDGKVGSFGREIIPQLREAKYGDAMLQITTRIAQTIAADAGQQITGVPARNAQPVAEPQPENRLSLWLPIVLIFIFFVLPMLFGRSRRSSGCSGCLWPLFFGGFGGGGYGGGYRGGWGGGSGGWGGFGGGSGGGGFGGFGGGSSGGGGAGGSW